MCQLGTRLEIAEANAPHGRAKAVQTRHKVLVGPKRFVRVRLEIDKSVDIDDEQFVVYQTLANCVVQRVKVETVIDAILILKLFPWFL